MKSTSTLETLQEADKIFGDNFNLISAEEMMWFFVVVFFFLGPPRSKSRKYLNPFTWFSSCASWKNLFSIYNQEADCSECFTGSFVSVSV